MRRPLLLAGLVAALAAVLLATGATAKPPPGRARVGGVSSGVPYVAPWQSGFRRYSTQLITPDAPDFTSRLAIVPEGQWWRIVYLSAALNTSAVVANRFVFFGVENPAGFTVMQSGTPANVPASASVVFLYGPNLTTFANLAAPVAGQVSVSLPDVLWGPGMRLRLRFTNPQAGDVWATIPLTFAVEVYTPEREGSPILVPTPVHP